MKVEKLAEIIDNYINGNISDFRKKLLHLTKLQLVELIDYWRNEYNANMNYISGVLRQNLK